MPRRLGDPQRLFGKEMIPAEIVDAHFQQLITRCDAKGRPTKISRDDRIIYYVIATRCEMDMNGFDNVFNQLLSKSELQFLIESLEHLDEMNLAASFQAANDRLDEAGFFDDESMMVWDLDDTETETGFLEDINEQVRQNNRLWKLDDKLVKLVHESAK